MQNLPHDEREIIGAILDAAAARGLLVRVHDGEEWTDRLSAAQPEARAAIGASDETILLFLDPKGADGRAQAAPQIVGRVHLVHGNGCDVIGDYTDSRAMSALLAPALAVSERAAL